jgi:hypothetical protein
MAITDRSRSRSVLRFIENRTALSGRPPGKGFGPYGATVAISSVVVWLMKSAATEQPKICQPGSNPIRWRPGSWLSPEAWRFCEPYRQQAKPLWPNRKLTHFSGQPLLESMFRESSWRKILRELLSIQARPATLLQGGVLALEPSVRRCRLHSATHHESAHPGSQS